MKEAPKTEVVKLRVPTEELQRWRAVATSRGLSKMIRDAVNEHISRAENPTPEAEILAEARRTARYLAAQVPDVQTGTQFLRRTQVVPNFKNRG